MRRMIAALLLMFGADSALAADIKFCFKVYGDYSDAGAPLRNGLDEDYWTNGAAANYLRGGKFTVRLGSSTGTLLASGYLGDGLGSGDPGLACTPVISLSNVNQTYWYRLDSEVDVNLNTIIGRRDDTGGTCYRSTTHTNTLGAGTYDITISGSSAECADVFRALSASAFSLYRHNGGNSGVTFNVRTGGTCSGCPGGCNTASGTTFCMSDAGANRKFTVSHEFGHSLAAARGGIPRACTFNDSAKCPSTSGDHAMASMEHATCALNEAFAHFVAADTYNNHAEDDCAFNYYKNYFPADPDLGEQVVDCEASSTDLSALEVGTTPSWLLHPIATLENVDPPNFSSAGCSTPYSGKATEVDWLRVLWNMHTDGTSPPTFNQILDWILNANVGSQTVFAELDAEANSVGGSLNSSWDSNKGKHAVDN